MKTYLLNPTTTFKTLNTSVSLDKSAEALQAFPVEPGARALADRIAPAPAPKPSQVHIDLPPRQPLPTPVIDPNKTLLKIGLDVHLLFVMAVIQRGHSAAQAPRKLFPHQLIALIKQWIAEGLQVFCVQESCGFGFVLHRELIEAGAQSFLITPVALNGKRKNDKLDARALCLRLSRFLDGDRDELRPIRIPTLDEQRRRESSRRRQFLQRQLRSLANHGHGHVAEFYHCSLPHRWWGARNWKKLSATFDPWLLDVLDKLRQLIVALDEQLAQLEVELKARVKDQELPKGLGELSAATLDAEICDWLRFSNRKQVGSYTGCCPGEHSSAGKRRMGSIDRLGNGRVRAILVEAVWRLLQWQPGWKAARKMKVKLAEGAAMRKKTVVALARQLAIDLWRWRTGRATLADLGWIAA
jgi:transposase